MSATAISFFDLLGVRDAASPRDAAVALWPIDWIQTSIGTSGTDVSSIRAMVDFLDTAITLHSVRPGAFPGGDQSGEVPRVGLTAELLVGAVTPPYPLVFRSLPKVEFHLLPTSGAPARIYVTQSASGVEWIIEALPVEIRLPSGLLMPLESTPGDEPPLESTVTDGFISGIQDTVRVILRNADSTSIFTHIKLRVSEQFDFLIETAVPISIGPCRFSGIPCRAIYDLNFILTPKPSDSMDARAEALEWVRHELSTDGQTAPAGFFTVRGVDLQVDHSRLDDAQTQANAARADTQHVEFVLEDLVIPSHAWVPMPVHFLAGVRRSIGPKDDPKGLYNLTDHPVVVPIIKGQNADQSGGLYMILEQFMIQSVGGNLITDPGSILVTTPQSIFLSLAFNDSPDAKGISATVDITDLWTLEAGLHFEPPKNLFTLFNVNVQAVGVRAGVSFQKLFENPASDGESPGNKKVSDALVFLADLKIQLGKTDSQDPAPKTPVVTVSSPSDKPTVVVIHDIGWKLGKVSVGSFWDPNSTELKAAGVMRLSIDEFGFVTEPNGARYFSFSGSWPVFGTPSTKPPGSSTSNTPPPAGAPATNDNALGIQFYRLRWKIHGPRDASELLIDGLGISMKFGNFGLLGFGMLSDTTDDTGIRYVEFGFEVQVQVSIGTTDLVIGAEFLHGHATGPSVDFTYILAGLMVSPIPITGAINLVNVRGLFAWNMLPRLGSSDLGTAQPMQLFDWYQAHGNGVAIPDSRNVSITGWQPQENAWAFAAGAGVSLSGNAVRIEAFFLYVKSPEVTGFLAALQIFLKGKTPIAYGVVEVEGDHWSVLIGVSIGTESFTGKKIPFLSDSFTLSGTLYITNKPATFAIGHVADTSSWLALHVVRSAWKVRLEFVAGLCLELVDLPDGPRAFGLRVSFTGGSTLLWIGGIDFYLTLEFLAGVWQNESNVSGYVAWLEGGINVNVLWVFQFGASFKVEWDYLGPDPAYNRIGCEVHIHTPWWMPDKTFRFDKTFNQPQLEQMSTVSTPVIESSAYPLAQSDEIPVATSPLMAGALDPAATFNLSQLNGITPPAWPADVLAQAVPVAIDSTVALHFKAAVDDKLAFGQITPPNVSTQTCSDVSAKYELVEMGIRRTPRFGPGAGTWTTLIDPAASRIENLANLNAQQLAAAVKAPFGIRWDADFQREQKLDPSHLLLNAEMPYRFFRANFISDENLVRNMPGWPCCPTFQKGVPWHTLDFLKLPLNARAPERQTFSDSQSYLRWIRAAPPLVKQTTAPTQVARLQLSTLTDGAFARITFDKLAAQVQMTINWPTSLFRSLVVSYFRGLDLVVEKTFAFTDTNPPQVLASDPKGFTHIVLRLSSPIILLTTPAAAAAPNTIEFVSMGYQALDEVLDGLVGQAKCGASNPTLGGNGSRFAWLANHDYEVQLRTRVSMSDMRSGTLQQEVPQVIFFRTKGLPGLNAAPRIGQEIEPFVDSLYPAPATLLYRSEPAVLAFNEKFDILQGLDQPVNSTDPDERKQRLDWILAAELISGNGEPTRASVPSQDWVVTHRGIAPPPFTRGPVIIGLNPADPILRALQRIAASTDPMRLRFDAMVISPGGCNAAGAPPRKMRVLAHDPVDPLNPTATPRLWPARAPIRLNMRVSGSPYIERVPFEADDVTAFVAAGGAWQVVAGAMTPAAPSTTAAQFAIFGDPFWEQFRLLTSVTPGGGQAGIAFAVAAAGPTSRALVVWVDEAQHKLRIVSRAGATETELASENLPPGATSPYALEVNAFDDQVQAQIGATVVSANRDDLRDGRLALAAQGPGSFASLIVDGIDAYRYEFSTSRFTDFAAHIASFNGTVPNLDSLAAPSQTIAQLLQSGATFDQWVTSQTLPLAASLKSIEISAHRDASNNVDFLLIESPEPLPIGGDVSIQMTKEGAGHLVIVIQTTVVLDATQTRSLLVPISSTGTPVSLDGGEYRIEFTLNRARYRAATPDSDSNLQQVAEIKLSM